MSDQSGATDFCGLLIRGSICAVASQMRKKMGRQRAPHFFCLIWLVVAQIDLRINSPQDRGRLWKSDEVTNCHRHGGYVTQNTSAALTFDERELLGGADLPRNDFFLCVRANGSCNLFAPRKFDGNPKGKFGHMPTGAAAFTFD